MPNQPKTQARTIRVPDDVWAAVRELASAMGLTTSDVVRMALRDFIEANRGV